MTPRMTVEEKKGRVLPLTSVRRNTAEVLRLLVVAEAMTTTAAAEAARTQVQEALEETTLAPEPSIVTESFRDAAGRSHP